MNLETELRRMARTGSAAGPLPSAELIWWKAEIRRVRRARNQSARPLAAVHTASCLAAAALALVIGGPGILELIAVPASLAAAAAVWKLNTATPGTRD